MQSGWAVGYILAALAANLVLPVFGWRVLFFIGVAPALFTVWLRARLTKPALAAPIRSLAKALAALPHSSAS